MIPVGRLIGVVILLTFLIATLRYYRKSNNKTGQYFWVALYALSAAVILLFDAFLPLSTWLSIPTFAILNILALFFLLGMSWYLYTKSTQYEKKLHEIIEEIASRDAKK